MSISSMPGPPPRQHEHERYTPFTHSFEQGGYEKHDYDGQMIFGDLVGLKFPDICLTGEEKPWKNLTQETCPDRTRCVTGAHACSTVVDQCIFIFSLVSAFSQKTKTYKKGLRARACVCVCVKFWSPLSISIPVIRLIQNFGHIQYSRGLSYRISPTPLISFLHFENCVREKFL